MCQTPKQNTINWESVIFLCLHFPVESCHILLLSNILDFVPGDLQLKRAYYIYKNEVRRDMEHNLKLLFVPQNICYFFSSKIQCT